MTNSSSPEPGALTGSATGSAAEAPAPAESATTAKPATPASPAESATDPGPTVSAGRSTPPTRQARSSAARPTTSTRPPPQATAMPEADAPTRVSTLPGSSGGFGSVSGTVVYRASRDGTSRAPAEPGIDGVPITLEWAGDWDASPANYAPLSTVSRDNGKFDFPRVPAGQWWLQLPADIDPTKNTSIKPSGLPELTLSEPPLAALYVVANQPRTLRPLGYRPAEDSVRGNGRATGGGAAGRGHTGGSLLDAVTDIAAYMPTAQQTFGPGGGVGGGGAGQSPTPARRFVDAALTEVLGRRLKTDDPTAIRATLERAFSAVRVDGRTRYTWTPRSYAVQTELGGEVTGAQASIYHRAKLAIEDALPLLEGLTALKPDADAQEVEAVRSIIQTELNELVAELGVEGGPRIQRVDDLFDLLDDQLKRLKRVFGLRRGAVVTVEEEQNLTNFLVVRDHVLGLAATWRGADGFRSHFTGGGSQFLGTQFVLLARALSVVAESVDEASQAMDAVLLGPAERQTVRIDLPEFILLDDERRPTIPDASGQATAPPSMLVDELLSWIARFATEEGPSLIQLAGRRGVAAIQPTAERLQRLVLGATQAKVRNNGFNQVRVQRALEDLADQLGQVDHLARRLLIDKELIKLQASAVTAPA